MSITKTLGADGYTVAMDPAGGEIPRAVTSPSGGVAIAGPNGRIPLNDQDKPILLMGGDHPYDQWYGNSNDGVAALYNSYGITPYVAINTQGTDTVIPGITNGMTWAQVAALNGSAIEVVAHGARHVYDHRLMNTGVRIQYTGANASASVNIDATTVTLTDSGAHAITITGITLTAFKALVDAVSGWSCTIAPELTGDEGAENLLLLNAARTIKTGGVVTAANTYFACGGGISIRYNAKTYANVHMNITSNVLSVYGDGTRLLSCNLTSASYDTFTELVAAINAVTSLNAFVCNNNIAVVPAATNYVLGDEKSTNLKSIVYANLTESYVSLDAGMPQWYMEERQLQKCKEDAAANGVTLTHYAQSGASFYPDFAGAHGQYKSYRGDSQTRVIMPYAEVCALSPANFFLHQYAPSAAYWTSAYLNAVVDALADSGPFRVNTLIHAVDADGSSGHAGIITHGSEDLEITETELVAHLTHVKATQDAGQLVVMKQSEATIETRRRNKPSNFVFNPKFRNSGVSILGINESIVANASGRIIPGWQINTATAFSAAAIVGEKFTATTTGSGLYDFLSAEVQLEAGKTYEFGALLEISAFTSGNGFRIGLKYNRGRIPLIAAPLASVMTNGYYTGSAGNAARMQHMKYLVTVPPMHGYASAKVVSANLGPYNLVSTPADIKLNIDGKAQLNINVAGATPAATTTDEVVAAINAAILASASYPAEYRNCAKNVAGAVVIEAPYVGQDSSPVYGIDLQPGTTNSATALIFGTPYTTATSAFAQRNQGPNFVGNLVLQCAAIGTWAVSAPYVREIYSV